MEDKRQHLMKFYGVESTDELIEIMARQIEKLQERLRKVETPFDFAPKKVRG